MSEGKRVKVLLGNTLIGYLAPGESPLVLEETDGTRHELTHDLFEAVAAIPDSDQLDSETIWNDDGTLKVSGSA